MKWRDRPVLVTGATGLLGRHLANALRHREASVVAIVRDRPPGIDNLSILVYGDITDQALIERVLSEYDIRTVYHLAAQTQVQVANRSPVGTFDSNIHGTWSVMEACRRVGVDQTIVASSDKAYGWSPDPYDESMPLDPVFPYDVSKACADLIARSYAHTYDMPVCVTRCGNLFGPGDLNWQRLIPGTMRSILRGEMPVIRSDGSLRRDYFYVEDAAGAYLHLAEQMDEDPSIQGGAFNFSAGPPITVLEMVRQIAQSLGFEDGVAVDIRDTAKGEIFSQHLDCSWAKERLGWVSQWPMADALKITADWYRGYLGDRDGDA